MKIILLHYSAPPVVGGVESVIGHHSRLMADDGHKVQIVAGRGEQTDERVRIVRIPTVDSRNPIVLSAKQELDRGIIPIDFDMHVEGLTNELWAVIKDADCLIAHNVCSLDKNLILTAALKKISEQQARPWMILWHHDPGWTRQGDRDKPHDKYPWDLLYKAWDRVEQVTISEYRRSQLVNLMNLPKEKIWIIPNGVDIERFLKSEAGTAAFIEQLELLHADPLLLLPARITSRKNIELALGVMAELRKQAPLAKLIVTGPLGPHNPANIQYFEKLKLLRSSLKLEDAVHFLAEFSDEYLPDEMISDFYHLADALFLPSREEGFGIPILEAGLAGMPAFCSDIPPLRELGRSYVNYFPLQEEPANIASMIFKILSTHPSFNFRRHVRSHYTWSQIYNQKIQPLLKRGVANEAA